MPTNTEHGFSLVELLITSLVLLVLLAGIATVFVTGVNYYGGEQRTAQMNGEKLIADFVPSGTRPEPRLTSWRWKSRRPERAAISIPRSARIWAAPRQAKMYLWPRAPASSRGTP